MDNFDDLVYSIRYELDAMQENLNNTDDLDGSEAKVNVLLKWIKNSANTIENKLYEIDQQLERLLELDTERMVDTETGEILTAEDIDKLQMDRAEKIEGCLLVIKNKLAEADAIDVEMKKLTDRKRSLNNKAIWLQEYVASSLNGETFSTSKVAVTYRKSEAIEVLDIDKISPEYIKTTISADKTAIKKAIKAGEVVGGAQLIERMNMQIK